MFRQWRKKGVANIISSTSRLLRQWAVAKWMVLAVAQAYLRAAASSGNAQHDMINLGIHQGQTGSIYIQEVIKHECKPPAGSIAASMALLKQVVPLQSYTRSNHPVAHRITGQCPATATQSLFTAKAST